jgi:hypothetical protein
VLNTLLSSSKSASIPDVAITVLSVSWKILELFLCTILYPSESLVSPITTTKSSPATAATEPS